jgi:hypothetical protein
VSLFGGVPSNLVNPLLESLRHNLQAKSNPLLSIIEKDSVSFDESVLSSIDELRRPLPNPRKATQSKDRQLIQKARRVRSIQRMPLPKNWDALKVANTYASWLSRSLKIVSVEADDNGQLSFQLLSKKIQLLVLTPTPYSGSGKRRCAYYITGGLLAKQVDPPGRFEFRIFPENDCLIAAIHGFVPRLPWWVYINSQAFVHLAVMVAFKHHLKSLIAALDLSSRDG